MTYPDESVRRSVRADIAEPIVVNGNGIGAIDLASKKADAFRADDIAWLSCITALIQSTIHSLMGVTLLTSQRIENILQIITLSPAEWKDRILTDLLTLIQSPQEVDVALLVVEGNTIYPIQRLLRRANSQIDHGQLATGWPLERGITGRAIRRRESIYVPDVNFDPDYLPTENPIVAVRNRRAEPSISRVVAEFVVTISINDEVIALFTIDIPEQDASSEQTLQRLKAFAKTYAPIIYVLRYISQIEREREQGKDIIHELAEIMPTRIRELAPDTAIRRILSKIRYLIPNANATYVVTGIPIDVVDDDRQHSELRLKITDRDPSEAATIPPYPATKGVTGEAIRRRDLQYQPDVTQLNEDSYIQADSKTISDIAIPLLITRGEEHIISALNIESRAYDAFTAIDQDVLRIMGAAAAFAYSDQLSNRYRGFKLVVDAAKNLFRRTLAGEADDPNDWYRSMIEWCKAIVRTRIDYISLLLVKEQQFYLAKDDGLERLAKRDPKSSVYPLDQGVVGLAYNAGEAIYIPDTGSEEAKKYGRPIYVRRTEKPMRSDLVLPISTRDDQIVALLNLEREQAYAFASYEVEILKLYALVLGTVFDIVSLHDEHRQMLDLLEQEPHTLKHAIHRLQQLLEAPYSPERDRRSQDVVNYISLILQCYEGRANHLKRSSQEVKDSVDINELVAKVVSMFQGYAAEGQAHISFHPSSRPANVFIDRDDVILALVENLENAVKHGKSKSGTIDIQVMVEVSFAEVRILIEHNGVPVPLDKREIIFERGERLLTATGTKGSGLGLYFAREAMRRQDDGDIFVDERPAGGSRFVLRISRPVS